MGVWPRCLPEYLPMSVLFLQTALPLLIRQTRRQHTYESSNYHPASVTLLAELCKCLVAFGFTYRIGRRQQPEATSLTAMSKTARKFREAILGGR